MYIYATDIDVVNQYHTERAAFLQIWYIFFLQQFNKKS